MKRVTALLAALVVATFAAAAPATAAPAAAPAAVLAAQDCEQGPAGDEYVPEEPCQITVDAAAVCHDDAPYLSWTASVEGTDATDLTVTFNNPSGSDAVYKGLPLKGELLWPGTVLGDDGKVIDWPGWTEIDGDWIVGDEWDWVRPTVDVTFSVNPEVTFTLAYPLPSSLCAGPADQGGEEEERSDEGGRDDAREDELGLTGFQGGALAGVAALLLGAGVVLVVARRRAQH